MLKRRGDRGREAAMDEEKIAAVMAQMGRPRRVPRPHRHFAWTANLDYSPFSRSL